MSVVKEKPKRYFVFSEGKFESTTINSAFFETHPAVWSARLSTGLFGQTTCPAGNRGPKDANEVILGVGDAGLAKLAELGFIPCSVCHPESSSHFSWAAVSDAAKARYGIADANEYADKTRVPYDARRLDWSQIINVVRGAPSRIYLPERLGLKEVESFRALVRNALSAEGVTDEPVLGYYNPKAADHFTAYLPIAVDLKTAAEAFAILMPDAKKDLVYFAHAQPVYGTEEEKEDLAAIARQFSQSHIVNPAAVKDYHIRDMNFYLEVVKRCKAIVFTRFRGVVMGGVGKEVKEAMENGIDAYERSGPGIFKVERVPDYLSHEDTVNILRLVGFRKD